MYVNLRIENIFLRLVYCIYVIVIVNFFFFSVKCKFIDKGFIGE